MSSSQTTKAPSRPAPAYCPYIGLPNDPGSLVAYASASNVCHHCEPRAIPALDHQSNHCLSDQHPQCPLFEGPGHAPMPESIRHSDKNAQSWASNGRPQAFPAWLVLAGIVLVLVIGGAIFAVASLPAAPSPTFLPPPNLTQITSTPSATLPPPASPTPAQPSPTVKPSATPTPVIARLLLLDTELGQDRKFIIHRMAEGENLDSLSSRNGTTQQAILAITYKLTAPVWAGKLIVLPVNQRDVSGLPLFQPYQVTQESITINDLAIVLGIPASELERYNICGECLVKKDSWILVPRQP
jgi:hypothetical protein